MAKPEASKQFSAAIVGGGIGGLSAAYALLSEAQQSSLSLKITLFEEKEKVGGVIQTFHEDGFLIEGGPDAFIALKPWGKALAEALGLSGQLLPTQPGQRQTLIVQKGKLLPLPEGFFLLAPTRLLPVATSPFFSPIGKLRMLLDLVLPARKSEADESLSHFVQRRLGKEVLEKLAQPLVSSIYTAVPERLSMKAALPQFVAFEKKYGSLIRAMLSRRREVKLRRSESGARFSQFLTLREGLSRLVDALVSALPEGVIHRGTPIQRVRQQAGKFLLEAENKSFIVDALILALPAPDAGTLLKEDFSSLASLLFRIPYAGSAIVHLGYERQAIEHPLNAYGFVVPRSEKSALLACSFSSEKFEGRAPAGKVLLRCFVGGAVNQKMIEKEDSAILSEVKEEVERLLQIRGKAILETLCRHPAAMPQYELGHSELVAQIEKRLAGEARLALVGNAYHGIGIPDVIHSSQLAATKISKALLKKASAGDFSSSQI